jgi:hypothetical protein
MSKAEPGASVRSHDGKRLIKMGHEGRIYRNPPKVKKESDDG